jgi:uncharacterized membrane protein (UPF0127 family)
MKQHVTIVDRKTGRILLSSVRWCSSFLCKLVGFQFRRRLRPGEALILVGRKDSINKSSIHMFFVFTALVVVWINQQGRVTYVQLARPWRPYYASPEPACYVLETSLEFLPNLKVGDEVDYIKN